MRLFTECSGGDTLWRRKCGLDFFFQAEDGIRDVAVTGVQTCALPIYERRRPGHHPGFLHPAAIRSETVRRGGVDPYHGPRDGDAASTRRPGPARRNHVVRTRRRQARPHRSARPGAAELPGLEVRVEAVGLEPLERPI